MGRACSMNGAWGRNTYRILVRKLEQKRHYKDQMVDVLIILRWVLDRIGWYGLDWSGSG
jgi:hypothetical protein